MDPPEELMEFLTLTDTILKESTSIPRQYQKSTYFCRNLRVPTLVSALLVYYILDPVFFSRIDPLLLPFFRTNPSSSLRTKLISFLSWYLMVVFSFPLLSAAVISFTPSRPTATHVSVTISGTIFRRLFVTYLWVYIIMALYNAVFLGLLVLLWDPLNTPYAALPILATVAIFLLLLVDDVSLCYMASKVSWLEPVYAFAALDKCIFLLVGRNRMAASTIVFTNLMCFAFINGLVGCFVVQGRFEYQLLMGMVGSLTTVFVLFLDAGYYY